MNRIKVEVERNPFGELEVYVTAPADTHHSTIASAAYKAVKAEAQPDYLPYGGEPKPGRWCQPTYIGPFKNVGGVTPAGLIKKRFKSWPVPDYR